METLVNSSQRVVFCATSRSGLGHLRRLSWIAGALRRGAPRLVLDLLTNADTSSVPFSLDAYSSRLHLERAAMTSALAASPPTVVVVDTAVLPGLEAVRAKRCLLLRRVADEHVGRFALPGTPWDLVVTPHPPNEWSPRLPDRFTERHEAVGWIFNDSEACDSDPVAPRRNAPNGGREVRRIVVTAGGGGADQTDFHAAVTSIVRRLRERLPFPIRVVLVRGPRTDEPAASYEDVTVPPVDGVACTAADADLVVSAAGYNSVLELARLTAPTLLVPLPRTYDDQFARARAWAPQLGYAYHEQSREEAVHWAEDVLRARASRAPVALGPSGAARAAALIAGLVCQQV